LNFKIAHVSDIHIRKLRYHSEYQTVFEELYDRLREEKPDIIINTGDTFHSKLDLSAEAVRMMSELFTNLADIAPYHMILGNHDLNCKNLGRLDAITPIVDNLKHPNIHFHKYSKIVPLPNDIDLHVLSIVDPENWPDKIKKDKTNIMLYHGSIIGAVTDTGWVMTHGDIDLEVLEKYDYAMLGDIHRTNQLIDTEGKARWPGSLIQQNFGESNDKGFLIWEIEDKEQFTCRHISLTHPKPFITISLTSSGKIPRNTKVAPGSRLRLVSNTNLPIEVARKATEAAKHRFNPESIRFLNRADGIRGNISANSGSVHADNLRDPKVQEELIAEYLKDFKVNPETLEIVNEINKRYNETIADVNEINRNVNWKLLSMRWGNTFNYGEENSIEFDRLSGVTGILGANFSGKSSVVDTLLYILFNTTSKNERKNLNIINQNKDDCWGEIKIEIGNKIYKVKRTSIKYTKKLKGEETLEAKTDLDFEVYDRVTKETTSLNAATRNQTDAVIRKHFGSIEDFFVSSMASQHGSLAFLEEGSTKRKEIIAKFLDLEVFEKKFKLAKEYSSEMKILIKKDSGKDHIVNITQEVENLAAFQTTVNSNIKKCSKLRKSLNEMVASLNTLEVTIATIPNEYIDIAELKKLLKEKKALRKAIKEKIVENTNEIKLLKIEIKETGKFLDSVNINELKEKQTEAGEITKKISKFNRELKEIKSKHALLNGIPCGNKFTSCKFIRDANIAIASQELVEGDLQTSSTALELLQPTEIVEQISEFKKLQTKNQKNKESVTKLELNVERSKSQCGKTDTRVGELSQEVAIYNKNKEAIENLERLLDTRDTIKLKIARIEQDINRCDTETTKIIKSVGSTEQKIEDLRRNQIEYEDLQKRYSAYDLFMRCTHPNGIAYDIIKKKIPVINQEIARVLANVVEFEVFFESSGNKFDIFIRHPKYEPRPIEMASGSEKTLAAIAIRLAMLGVSSLPTSSVFILDEPGTALDEDNMSGFIQILELIKVYFKNVLLISHLDSLKDCVDTQIIIDKVNGYAKVNV
tara:strand:+ start:37117 stop:40233 length:3117 start_codon:yes stop_codon:yes gene_type:complete